MNDSLFEEKKTDIDIDLDKFESWVASRFPYFKIKGEEYQVNSVFIDDQKRHLWVNPYKGVFHCWKSDERGSIPSLVMKVDKCDFREALDKVAIIPGDIRFFKEKVGTLQDRVSLLKGLVNKQMKEEQRRETLLPDGFRSFNDEPLEGYEKEYEEAHQYLLDRKINPESNKLGYCYEGPYKGYIILPVFNESGELEYWTSRAWDDRREPRYKNPDKGSFGGGRDSILWAGEKWPDTGKIIFLTEGIFDAMTLQECSLSSMALLGKEITSTQAQRLAHRKYNVIISSDNDKKGLMAVHGILECLNRHGVPVLGGVTPPEPFKDWNKMATQTSFEEISSYIPTHINRLDLASLIKNSL